MEAGTQPVMTWMTAPDGACVYLSDGWYAFTGQTPEAALGHGWPAAAHPDDHERATERFLRANEERTSFAIEYRLRRHDGAYRWAIAAAAPRFAEDGAFLGFVGAVIDVTVRHEAEAALRESEARFRTLFTVIDEGYCLCEMVLDGEGRPVDYVFLETNPLFEEMTGLRDAVGRRARDLVPGLEDHWVERYGRVALEGEPLRFEQGSEAMGRFFDVFAAPVPPLGRFALVFKDITARRRADEALRESREASERARQRAELLGDVSVRLEADDDGQRTRGLAELLVPRLGDVATVVIPGHPVVVHPPGAAGAAGADADAPVRSRISVPLEAGLDAPGSLSVAVVDRERPEQTAADEALLREVADRASVVLTRARLRESEHRVAVRLQEALLPGALRHPPSVQVAARYAAGSDLLEVGGDWYDAFELPGRRVALAVGDVVGHGLEAAATMGRLRVALHALAPHAAGPAALLSHLDGFAAAAQVTDYATVCAVEVEPATGALRYARAGHPPPLVVAPDGTTTWLDRAGSMPLHGAPRPAPRPEATATLAPGALLVLYSDGLVERRGEDLDGRLARLAAVASDARDLDLGAVCDRLLAAMDVAAARDDDVVVLCLRLAAAR